MGNSHDPAERWNVARDWVSTVDLPLYVTRCDGRLPWIADSSASCQLHCRAGLCSRAVGKQSARRGLAKLSQHHGIRRTRAKETERRWRQRKLLDANFSPYMMIFFLL